MGPGLTYMAEPIKTKESCSGSSGILKYGAVGMQGWRIKMEDAHISTVNFGEDPTAALFAVFDGHGGREVAEFARIHFAEELLKNPKYGAKNYKEALEETFLKIDVMLATPAGIAEISEIARKFSEDSSEADDGAIMRGCTSNVLLIKEGYMYIANAGDSRCIAIKKGGKVQDLSLDHKPESLIESERIYKAGGYITNGRIEGNLNLSRALGDLHYKSNSKLKPEEQKITSFPDVESHLITPEFEYIVMGCDGIYETKTSQEIGNFVLKDREEYPSSSLDKTAGRLMDSIISPDFAETNGIGCDNMTCIIIQLSHY